MTEETNLSSYLAGIRDDPAEFRTVTREVDPNNFDVTAVLDHMERRGDYAAVEFLNPLNLHREKSEFPIVTNLWATRERCAEAVGISRSEAGALLGTKFAGLAANHVAPQVIASADAPVQAHVWQGEDADLWRLPAVRHAEMDLGPCLTMALAMHAPGEQAYNVTFVKSFPETGRRGGLTIHGKDMGRMTKAWERRGEPIPVVNILGHHPGFWLGSLHKTPYGVNEYETISAYTGGPVRLAPSVTWGEDFLVPADAEIIVEGHMVPGERTIVDPFGEISRQYQPQQLCPVMEVTAISYRDGARFQDIFSGHREHMLMGSIPKEGDIYDFLQKKFGFIHAVCLPYSGCGRYSAYISVRRDSAEAAKQVALQALAFVPNLHVIVIVDDDIDVLNEEDVVWAANTYVDPSSDVNVLHGIHESSDPRGMGASRVMIDATRPTRVPFPTRLRVPPEALARVKLDEFLDQAHGSH